MNVLFITRKWPPAVGGMELYSFQLTESLKSLSADVHLLKLPGQLNGRPPNIFQVINFFAEVIIFLIKNRNSYDVVHFADFVLFPLAYINKRLSPKMKQVITVHGLDILYGNRKGVAPYLYRLFMSWAIRNKYVLKTIITNSSNTSRLVENMGLGESIPIPLGVVLSENQKYLPVSPDENYILFFGRLVNRKGAAWFASNILPKLPNNITMKVVGKIWDESEGDILHANKRVELLGYLKNEQLEKLKQQATLIVMPNIPSENNTDVEGFGLAALEASASGAPLVASNLEGIKDAVINGQTGFLVNPLDINAWINKVIELVNWSDTERKAFAENAFEVLKLEYSWKRVAQRTLEAYQS